MKSMTRFVTVLLALLMVVALGACGGTSSATRFVTGLR